MTSAAIPGGAAARSCVGCGYDLRALPAEGTCPECGIPIARSLSGDRLRSADEAWTRRLSRGLAWIDLASRGILLLMLAMLIMIIVGMISMAVGWRVGDWRAFELIGMSIGWGLFVLVFPIAAGLWAASAGDPSRPAEARRVGALRTLGLLVIPAFGFWRAANSGGVVSNAPLVEGAIATVCVAIVAAHAALMHAHASAIERRCPERPAGDDEKRDRKPRRAIGTAIIFLALFWGGPLRWQMSGGWSAPTSQSETLLFAATGLLWFVTVRRLAATRKIVTAELGSTAASSAATKSGGADGGTHAG